MARVITMDLDRVLRRGRENLRNRSVQLLSDAQLLDAPLAQLRITHDLGNNAVGSLDFLLNDLELFSGDRFALFQGSLQGEGCIGDDRQRIFDLMRKLGRQTASGAQLAFPETKFPGFFFCSIFFPNS